MTDQAIKPVSHAIESSVIVPGSKSITNRALLLAALANGRSKLDGVLFSEDTEAFTQALIELGLKLHVDREHCRIEIKGEGGHFSNQHAKIYCKDAGTVTRFLIPVCAAMATGNYHFSASERMSERPIKPLLEVLEQQGAKFLFESEYRMPFELQANGLKGGKMTIDITDSSQFLSGLLMAAPYAKSPMILISSKALQCKDKLGT